jgi:hypothetical protein
MIRITPHHAAMVGNHRSWIASVFLSHSPNTVVHMDNQPSSPAPSKTDYSQATVSVDGPMITIANLCLRDDAAAAYLAQFSPDRRAEELLRAISLGVHGLASTSMRATVDEMKDEVHRILAAADTAAESLLGRAIADGKSQLAAHLDPEIRSSLTARTVAELEEVHRTTLARLDPDRTDSHAAKLVAAITDLLGPEGLLAQRLESAFDSSEAESGIGRLLDTVERRFQEMRDLMVGEQHRAAEATRGTAKGIEFEDEVEELLRSEARALHGCVVERTGQLGGTLGIQSKVGDFVVALPDGTRVAIEVKNTARIGLTGTTGILEELDQAMANRDAGWAICVSRRDAYPAEVGSFAVYGNRILVVDCGDGPLTGVALRWIAAAISASATDTLEIDAAAAFERLGRIRDLAQTFSRSKKVLTTAQSGLDSVRQDLDSLRAQLLDLTDDLGRALRSSPESPGVGHPDRSRTFAA